MQYMSAYKRDYKIRGVFNHLKAVVVLEFNQDVDLLTGRGATYYIVN